MRKKRRALVWALCFLGEACDFGVMSGLLTAVVFSMSPTACGGGTNSSIFVSNPGAAGGVTPGGYTIVGYLYVNTAGQYFIQSTGADGSFFANLATSTPLRAAINNTRSGITPPLTGQQMNQFFKDYPINGTGKGTGYCFSKPLPV